MTERTSSITYTSNDPLPDGQRDTFELSFQVPDAEGETVSFPTIQTCQKGETRWVEVPAEGQDADELESPAPSFVILPASGEGDHHGDDAAETDEGSDEGSADQASASGASTDAPAAEATDGDRRRLLRPRVGRARGRSARPRRGRSRPGPDPREGVTGQ